MKDNMIGYRKANAKDVGPALDLAYRVFMAYTAPDYAPQAAVNFKKDCIDNRANAAGLVSGEYPMFIASDGKSIVGMAAGRDHGEILMLFVDGAYHRRGIAAVLTNNLVSELKMRWQDRIILDSSPRALPFYLKYGFRQTGEQKDNYGCIVTPMEYFPGEIWDVLDRDGNKTGRYTERGRKLTAGDYHLVVNVWKHNGRGEWLIDLRSPDRGTIADGKWETTGGSAIAGEDSLAAALRETREELGIELDPARGTMFRRIDHREHNGHTWFQDVWVFETDLTVDDIRFQKSETCAAMWATADKIRAMIKSGEFLDKRFYPYFEEMTAAYT
ncbi:MAG: GNAT family N-acetyltransferase [Eubacteriales bacterium]|nr:GNAT family N-acetyltransferase [Eubacteriales bacterium]